MSRTLGGTGALPVADGGASCVAGGMTRIRLATALLLALLPPPCAAAEETPVAALRALGTGGAEMRARVEDGPAGYRLVIHCESGCSGPVEHEEVPGDIPLGLFQLWDGDGLLLSIWATASAYIVRAHLLTPGGVRPVLQAASRTAPALALDRRGRMTVTTTERTGGWRDPLRAVAWRWDGAHFRSGQRVGGGD